MIAENVGAAPQGALKKKNGTPLRRFVLFSVLILFLH